MMRSPNNTHTPISSTSTNNALLMQNQTVTNLTSGKANNSIQPDPDDNVFYHKSVPSLESIKHEEKINSKFLNEAVITSPFSHYKTDKEREHAIVTEFNRYLNGKSHVSNLRPGTAIEPGLFWLIQQDGQSELVAPTSERLSVEYNPFGTSTNEYFKQSSLTIGWKGHFVINVPTNKVAKVKEGNALKFYGPGFHVIHAPSLNLKDSDLIEPDTKYAAHGNLHLLRIPPDEIALITINKIPYILKPREGHYAIESAYMSEPPQFVKRNISYHMYGNYQLLNIPEGKLAKIKINNKYYLLQAREETYVFDDPSFALSYDQENNVRTNYVNANSALINHGPITSVLPRTGQVAVAFDNGNMVIIQPGSKPFLKNNSQFTCDRFLSTSLQNENYPSEERKRNLRKNGTVDEDQIQFICARTKDNLSVGVQLQVTFQIDNPALALRKFPILAELKAHIEDTVTSEMATEIAARSLRDFQSAGNTHKEAMHDNAPAIFSQLATTATEVLAGRFARELGISLTQLRIERQKVLDKSIEAEMSKNALTSAKTNADMANLVMDTDIKKKQAERDATINAIKQQQEIQNTVNVAKADKEARIAKAEAELETAKRQADITREQARAEADKTILLANASAEKAKIETTTTIENKLKLLQMETTYIIELAKAHAQAAQIANEPILQLLRAKGDIFEKHPSVQQQEIIQMQTEAVGKNAKWYIDPKVAAGLPSLLLGNSMFSPQSQLSSNNAQPAARLDNTPKH